MRTNEQVPCPECQALITLQPKAGDPTRLVAFHDCGGRNRAVIETDAPPSLSLEERLQPSENWVIPTKKQRRK